MIVDIAKLQPTQLVVGFEQVNEKVTKMQNLKHKKLEEYLFEHIVPIILGPNGTMFIIDHHHFCLAAQISNINNVYGKIIKDLSKSNSLEFWQFMEKNNYIWPYNTNGVKITLDEYLLLLPSEIKNLKDDPYRSLAGLVRKSGGFEKDLTPFSEFHWSNFFRNKIPEVKLSDETIDYALFLSKSADAKHLPGYKAFKENACI
jgi:hypothetical protein